MNTASGHISPPAALCRPGCWASDGKTLVDFDGFADMMATMLDWAKRKEGLDFTLFGPLNETDIGDPEGPTVGADDYVRVCEVLDAKLRERKLDDIKLVVAEQAHFNADYLKAFAARPGLKERIGVFALHDYSDISPESYREVTDLVSGSAYDGTPLWMTEFGDLEQSGDREWYVAWLMTSRLFDQLEAGFHGALVWDAYDNYHDHNEYWTIYGLLRTGLYTHTPKKRYHAMKQIFRFVRPGFQRIAVECDAPDLRLLAFTNADRTQIVVTGINSGAAPARLNVMLTGLAESVNQTRVACYRTTETENCALTDHAPITGRNWPFRGIDICVPPASIFTLTNLRNSAAARAIEKTGACGLS